MVRAPDDSRPQGHTHGGTNDVVMDYVIFGKMVAVPFVDSSILSMSTLGSDGKARR